MFSMNSIRQKLGEDDIDALIKHIDDSYPQLVSSTETDGDDFLQPQAGRIQNVLIG
jgi:hypothetical protein